MKKIVSPGEMQRVERVAIEKGCTEEGFILRAGKAVAKAALEFNKKSFLLLVGKGGNGSDALASGIELLKAGFEVWAMCPFGPGSDFQEKLKKEFAALGGKPAQKFPGDCLIIDGLFGIGFKGKCENGIIERANRSSLPILSIDIPSGLDAETGEGEAIKATATIYMGMPKKGLFVGNGWDFAGKLIHGDFGLKDEDAIPTFYMLEETDLTLPSCKRTRHKYEAGLVIGIGGSKDLLGAIKLSGLAALKAGAGIVKLFVPPNLHLEEFPLELIVSSWDRLSFDKAKAVFIGPGMGREKETKEFFLKIFSKIKLPVVLDADALYFLRELKTLEGAILTPHKGEMKELLQAEVTPENCQKFVDEKNCFLVLKGALTFLFQKGEVPIVVPRGDPGMATAGSGDVLTGIIASFLAQGLDLKRAASLGVYLHAVAGEMAARENTSYCLIASDIISFLPMAFKKVALNSAPV